MTQLKVPPLGESITEVEVVEWLKKEGERVDKDEAVARVESEKATVELPAPEAGTLAKVLKKAGETAKVGEAIGEISDGSGPKTEESKEPEKKPERPLTPSERRRRLEEEGPAGPAPAPPPEGDETVRQSALRRTIARRLVAAQNESVWLSTFSEADCSAMQRLRSEAGAAFKEKHGVRLGLMPFFVRAVVEALAEFPQLNAELRGEELVLKRRRDVGIAVSTERGLVVPVLRGAQALGFAGIEKEIQRLAGRARDRSLEPAELENGTFTITNGGVFGSLLSTPVVNPPQTAVLGLHAIVERPVARGGQVVIRPMMYLALTYDHRAADGREAVSFLKRVRDAVEEPSRLLLGL